MEIKTNEQLIDETVEEFGLDKETDMEKIDKIVGLKKDRFNATKKKNETKETLKKMTKGKEFYKSKAKSATKSGEKTKEKIENPKGKTSLISTEDKAYLWSRLNMTRTEVKLLEKAMRIDDVNDISKALKGQTFNALKAENDKLIKRRGSQLGASRGGSMRNEKDNQKIVDKFSQNLPRGLARSKK